MISGPEVKKINSVDTHITLPIVYTHTDSGSRTDSGSHTDSGCEMILQGHCHGVVSSVIVVSINKPFSFCGARHIKILYTPPLASFAGPRACFTLVQLGAWYLFSRA